jgi:hypothetical protein
MTFLPCVYGAVLIQALEIEQFKTKLKHLSDYDEIKRELGIMKVTGSFIFVVVVAF